MLQNLGYVINQEKSQLTPVHKIEFLGLVIDSQNMTLSLPQEKVQDIQQFCTKLKVSQVTTVQELASLIGKLSFSPQAVLPGRLQTRFLQMQQIEALKESQSYQAKIVLNPQSLEELNWWINNLTLYNGKPLTVSPPDIILQTDASKKGWGASCQGNSTGGKWSLMESGEHINILELMAVELAVHTFLRDKYNITVHLQVDNMTALSYVAKMGGTKCHVLVVIAKRIWEFLTSRQIMITVEYIPSILNVTADWESRNHKDSSDWQLDPQIFQFLMSVRQPPAIDLFASRLNAQLSQYMSWKPDPYSVGTDALQHSWRNLYGYAFPPFCLISRVLEKVQRECTTILLITPVWQTQVWYPVLLEMSVENPLLLPVHPELLKNPQGEIHPLVMNNHLRLAAWTVSGNHWLKRDYRVKLQTLSQIADAEAQFLITNRPGESGLAGVSRDKLIPFDVM